MAETKTLLGKRLVLNQWLEDDVIYMTPRTLAAIQNDAVHSVLEGVDVRFHPNNPDSAADVVAAETASKLLVSSTPYDKSSWLKEMFLNPPTPERAWRNLFLGSWEPEPEPPVEGRCERCNNQVIRQVGMATRHMDASAPCFINWELGLETEEQRYRAQRTYENFRDDPPPLNFGELPVPFFTGRMARPFSSYAGLMEMQLTDYRQYILHGDFMVWVEDADHDDSAQDRWENEGGR